MNRNFASVIVLTPLSLLAAVASGCSVNATEEAEGSTASSIAAGPQIWQFNRECGTRETGECGARPDCPSLPNGTACASVGDRCITPPNPAGRRKVFACVPSNTSGWAFNGDGTPGQFAPCPAGVSGVAGTACATPLARCSSDARVFVCLPGGKDVFAFTGYCGRNGGPACSTFANDCPSLPDGVAGAACAVDTICKTISPDKVSGKVFKCVSR